MLVFQPELDLLGLDGFYDEIGESGFKIFDQRFRGVLAVLISVCEQILNELRFSEVRIKLMDIGWDSQIDAGGICLLSIVQLKIGITLVIVVENSHIWSNTII
jgi:hypothetical protein